MSGSWWVLDEVEKFETTYDMDLSELKENLRQVDTAKDVVSFEPSDIRNVSPRNGGGWYIELSDGEIKVVEAALCTDDVVYGFSLL